MGKRVCSFILMLSFLLAVYGPVSVYASYGNPKEDNYTYDFWAEVNKSLPAFELVRIIDSDALDLNVSGFDDVCSDKERIFLLDTKESRLNILNTDYQLLISIKLIRNQENKIVTDPDTGNQLILTNPEGVWYHEGKDEIYIADTGAERIIVLDGTGYYLKKIIERPANMAGVTQFIPSKIAVDQADKIYVVVQSGFEGIIELDKEGNFTRYFGVNKPMVNFWDFFWKNMSSDVQKSKMAKTYAPSFNNIAIDHNGFAYAVTTDSAAQSMVFRLNPKGENVLREAGYFKVIGDIYQSSMFYVQSQFVDVAVNDYGVYALLDKAKGRIFLHNFDGEILNIFGSLGDFKGTFKAPTSIAWFKDSLVITDKTLGCAYVYEMTEFGKAVLMAAKHYYDAEWEESYNMAREAIRLNANYDIGYISIGKYYLMKKDYKSAMYYFKLGNDKVFYSKAYNGYRNIWIQNNFLWIFILFIIAAVTLIYSELRYHKKLKKSGSGGQA